MRMLSLVILTGLSLAGCVRETAPNPVKAASTIKLPETFAIGGVGYAGIITERERNLRASLARPDARDRLIREFKNGGPVAQLYALTGLHVVDRSAFDDLYPQLANSKVKVDTMSGCIASKETAGSLAQAIRAGRYDVYFSR